MNPVLVDGVLWVPVRAEIPGVYGDLMEPLDRSDPEYDEWFAELQPGPEQHGWEEMDAITAAVWDPTKHPRDELGRWAEVHEALVEEKAQIEKMWAAEPDRENDFYSDYYRMWADNQFGNGGRSTLPDDWQKGWTWGEDAEAVDRAIYESEPLHDDIAVWRGAYNQSGEPSSRPISTSFEKGIALSYADRTGRDQETHLIRVLVPAGSHVGWHTNESEIVLPTGTRLERRGDEWVAIIPPEMVEGFRSSAWDESKHPRDPGGEGGGQFVEAGVLEADAPVMGLGAPGLEEKLRKTNAVPELVEQQMEADLKDFLDNASLNMRMPEEALLEALSDDEFMNQHQAGNARGMGRTVESEARMFGLPEGTPAEGLAKYGYLGPDHQGVIGYGPIKVVFKDSVKDRATFTVNDSFMQGDLVMPSKVRDPSYLSANLAQIDEAAGSWASDQGVELDYGVGGSNLRYGAEPADFIPDGDMWHEAIANERTSIPYVEAQIYGKLTPADIDHVEVLAFDDWDLEDPNTGLPQVTDRATMEAVISKLNDLGIAWYEYNPPGDYSGEWA